MINIQRLVMRVGGERLKARTYWCFLDRGLLYANERVEDLFREGIAR